MSESQTASLAEFRNKQTSGDEDSLHYEDAGQAKNEAGEEANCDDVYDDTNEELYEEVGTAAQSAASNQQSQAPTQDVDYEISAVAVPTKPASAPGWYSWLCAISNSTTPVTAVKPSEISPEHSLLKVFPHICIAHPYCA